ncbi:uncharacterized protein C6orf132 homolog [Sceloporus undulatus]|uniref:uncharacterized protein C6orf132 homolog n=1 Tax=Sceloporus undulatus TaxID=8520 RepID=UPI001C4CED59|nr:uncharacterized protein C6orf132 homolog [Sceloporus undulatus]
MKKHHSVQGTISRLFGKKHASNNSASSLFVTNPPWIFTQEVKSDTQASFGEVDGIYYGDNRFGSVTDSGTATLKPRPRVRPLLTFLPLNAQEAHGVAVPTPSVPEGFEEKSLLGPGSQINGSYRKYNSVLDLRPKPFENYLDDDYIPPPPSVPPPPPPSVDLPVAQPSIQVAAPPSLDVPPPPSVAAPPPPPPSMPPPPPPSMPAQSPSSLAPPSYPYSNLSSPSTPSPPDFIPPTPPLAFIDGAAPPHSPPLHTPPFSNGVSKWKSETVLNIRELDTIPHNLNLNTPSTPTQKESQLSQSSPDPHLTFPRSLKIPPPTPVRTSSIPPGEKETNSKDELLPKMVPHSRPALPPNFTVRPAAAVHTEGEAKAKTTLEKPSILITESGNPKIPSDSNGSSTTPHASSDDDHDDDDWKERTSLDKLKHELSALLSSSCRKEDRQQDRTVSSKPKTSITDSNQVVTDGLKQAKPATSGPQSPQAIESERREKTPANTPSPRKAFIGDAISTSDTQSASMQANCVITYKDELEALLSPTKNGGPPLALTNLRHNPETKKQVTLQFGGSQINSGETRLPIHQNSPASGVAEKDSKAPSTSSGYSPTDNTQKPPVSPLKPKNGLSVPAAPSSASSGVSSPIRTASPTVDFSLLQYKLHRTKFGSVDSLASATSSQTTEDGPANLRDFAEPRSPITSTLSRNADKTDSEVLIHPVTGEKVERGSPMALLLAAQQRAQRGRRSAVASRQNSYLSEKPLLKLSEKLHNSSQSDCSSTIYYSDAKPNSITVVPKSLQKESLEVSENKSQNITPSNAYRSSSLVQSLLESSNLKQEDPHSVPGGTTAYPHTTPPNHTLSSNEDVEEEFDYEIIPPPPEFSNDASAAPDVSSNGEENHKDSNIPSDFQTSDKRLNCSHSSYDYGNNYSLKSKPTLENNMRPSGYSHHYPGGSYSSSYLSSYSNNRPLIKKRLYVSETDRSYGRAAMSTRSMSTPATYGHNTLAYNSQAVEGMHRVNSTHRNVTTSKQGRRVSLELPGKILTYNNASSDARYKSQSGEYTTNAAGARRPSHGSLQYDTTANTFTVRPGTRQPISYSYQGGLR